jgi:nucleoside-diphosphate-sugar epimerase
MSYDQTGKVALVCGAGGFIGHHLVRRLKREGFWVRGTDLKFPCFSATEADDFVVGDLRNPYFVKQVIDRRFDEIYQLAADMGGAGYIFTGEHDADVMRIARYHNIFGPEGSWNDGKEKAPAAICRKLAVATDGGDVVIWGDGGQIRSFLYINECLDGTLRLMRSKFAGPVNIGSDEMVTINRLVDLVSGIAGKSVRKCHIEGPTGVRGRKSDSRLIRESGGHPRARSWMGCARPMNGSVRR